MTKIKNTKKGMAKKTLSMSLVVAMLATSNVPVWAAEFSDGSDASVATEAPAAETFSDETADAPIVNDTTEATPASTMINEGNMSIDLSVDKSKIVWGNTAVATIKGTVNKDGVSASSWKYRWVDENGVSVTPTNVTVSDVADMSLFATSDLAGKTLTLYVYDVSVTNQTLYDINTGITVTVEKQDLKDVANIVGVEDLKYNGFAQSVNTSGVKLNGVIPSTTGEPYYTLTSTSGINAGDEITVTASADDVPNSPYKGSISTTAKIVAKTYNKSNDDKKTTTDIIADVTKGLSFPYTGRTIHISKDNVTVTESKSENNGADDKLGGADLSGAFKDAIVAGTDAKNYVVNVTLDGDKLTNFKNFDNKTLTTKNTVEITKRDLSTAGTKISVNTASGYVPVATTPDDLGTYLTFTGIEGTELNLTGNYTLTVQKLGKDGKPVSTLAHDTKLENGSTYSVTVSATANGNCKNEQTFQVVATSAVLNKVESDHE